MFTTKYKLIVKITVITVNNDACKIFVCDKWLVVVVVAARSIPNNAGEVSNLGQIYVIPSFFRILKCTDSCGLEECCQTAP